MVEASSPKEAAACWRSCGDGSSSLVQPVILIALSMVTAGAQSNRGSPRREGDPAGPPVTGR
ncbi:hypothetical protein GCM10009665_01850 [Kitasatospora nipponensis]|uniref:Uncharacterized protein n=1 Tax=Kitasatospora nipponensis TaxID=258049 RepID=A0ABN1VLJ6_9ACTN